MYKIQKVGLSQPRQKWRKKGVNMELLVLSFSDDSIILQKNRDLCTYKKMVDTRIRKPAWQAGYNCTKSKNGKKLQ